MSEAKDNPNGEESQPDHDKVIHYFVNAESQETSKHELTVRAILVDAGFKPAEDYELTRDEGHHTYKNLDEEVRLHEGERFTATFVGPTPTSLIDDSGRL